MGEFFKGWRRKIGVVTLLMALAFMAGWVRSLSNMDIVCLPADRHTLIFLASEHQSITFQHESHMNTNLPWECLDWISGPAKIPDPDKDQTHWLWKWHGFAFADGINYPDIPPTFQPAMIWVIPYWSITIPLTLISLFLLLSKPRKTTPMKITEHLPVEGK